MAVNTLKWNHLTPLGLEGLIQLYLLSYFYHSPFKERVCISVPIVVWSLAAGVQKWHWTVNVCVVTANVSFLAVCRLGCRKFIITDRWIHSIWSIALFSRVYKIPSGFSCCYNTNTHDLLHCAVSDDFTSYFVRNSNIVHQRISTVQPSKSILIRWF